MAFVWLSSAWRWVGSGLISGCFCWAPCNYFHVKLWFENVNFLEFMLLHNLNLNSIYHN
jgi:hypothetical protein